MLSLISEARAGVFINQRLRLLCLPPLGLPPPGGVRIKPEKLSVKSRASLGLARNAQRSKSGSESISESKRKQHQLNQLVEK